MQEGERVTIQSEHCGSIGGLKGGATKREVKTIYLSADGSGRGVPWDEAISDQADEIERQGSNRDVSIEYDALKLQQQVLDSLGFIDCDVERVYSNHETLALKDNTGGSSDAGFAPFDISYSNRSSLNYTEAMNNDSASYGCMAAHARQSREMTTSVNVSRQQSVDRTVSNLARYNTWEMEDSIIYRKDVQTGGLPREEWPSLSQTISSSEQMTPDPPDECLVGIDGQYQPYCHQIITPVLNQATILALTKLKNMQVAMDASITTGHGKGSHGKKYYCSLKEVSKVARTCKLLVIAPDVKPSPTAHIKPVRMLMSVIEDAAQAGVPYIFALSRKGIGQIFGKDKHMSIMALMSLDQIEDECAIMVREATYGKTLYESLLPRNRGIFVNSSQSIH